MDATRHRTLQRIVYGIQALLLVAAVTAIFERQWFTAFLTLAIAATTAVPMVVKERYQFRLPVVLEVAAVCFVFAALFLGEVRGFYAKYWWWDLFLHSFSGLLLGILGFLLVDLLNRVPSVRLHMRPGFVAFFAFVFAVAVGALWEIFEYAMDLTFGLNMQKSGLDDTMEDLIVDTVGAGLVAVAGYLATSSRSEGGASSYLRRVLETYRDG